MRLANAPERGWRSARAPRPRPGRGSVPAAGRRPRCVPVAGACRAARAASPAESTPPPVPVPVPRTNLVAVLRGRQPATHASRSTHRLGQGARIQRQFLRLLRRQQVGDGRHVVRRRRRTRRTGAAVQTAAAGAHHFRQTHRSSPANVNHSPSAHATSPSHSQREKPAQNPPTRSTLPLKPSTRPHRCSNLDAVRAQQTADSLGGKHRNRVESR